MDNEQLQRALELAREGLRLEQHVTRGPWKSLGTNGVWRVHPQLGCSAESKLVEKPEYGKLSKADCSFIAHARNSYRELAEALIATVEEHDHLRQEREEFRAWAIAERNRWSAERIQMLNEAEGEVQQLIRALEQLKQKLEPEPPCERQLT
jgi:hypothetical protein